MHLFVYGTLRRGEATDLAGKLANQAAYVGEARARGRLFMLTHYPGFVRSDAGWVTGDLYGNVTEELFRLLDDYEGSEYSREVIDVVKADGEIVSASVYAYVRPTKGLQMINSGDWLRRTAEDVLP